MADLDQLLAGSRKIVDAELDRLVPAADIEPVRLHEAIRWSLFGDGKRFRPALLIAVGDVFGAPVEQLVRSAAAIEMIHTFSLIHDDLPAMDDDDLRRGQATCHKKYGEATAILAGDVLQTLAFKALAEDVALDPSLRVQTIALIASASGTPSGMVAGQQLDLEAEGGDIGIDDLENIHSRKTGALMAASAVVGAMIGGANEIEISSIEKFASRLGLLFQITDDVLDVTQTTGRLGKTAGKDAASGKATYPGHFGVEKASEMAMAVCDQACNALGPIQRDTTILHEIAHRILNRTA